jgi:hypothetical protein
LLGTDAFQPTIFNTNLHVGWTPTVEPTAHVRARPAPRWLKAQFRTRFVTGGFLEEDGELWDSSGRLWRNRDSSPWYHVRHSPRCIPE